MKRALVIDDDRDTRELLAELVRAEGYAVRAAGSLAEARAALALEPPTVILADLVLPDGSGIAFMQELDSDARPSVVLMTGHASLDTSIDALMHRYGQPGSEKRMLAILNEGAYGAWLSAAQPEKAREFMRAYPAEGLTANPIEKKRSAD